MDPLVARVVAEFPVPAPDALAAYTWVNVAGADIPPRIPAARAGELLVLPFSNTAAVVEAELGGWVAFMLTMNAPEVVLVNVCTRTAQVELTVSLTDAGEWKFTPTSRWFAVAGRKVSDAMLRQISGPTLDTLRVLHGMADRQYTAYQPVPHPKAAARTAQGRKPTYEWRTVVIEPRKPKTEYKGGTHASPRQHDRRGHWATSKLGKRFWRPPCKVGKASNGTVFHDYVVKGE